MCAGGRRTDLPGRYSVAVTPRHGTMTPQFVVNLIQPASSQNTTLGCQPQRRVETETDPLHYCTVETKLFSVILKLVQAPNQLLRPYIVYD